jgi:hypothetical protein
MDQVAVVVGGLDAATASFVELGMGLEGKAPAEGRWVDRGVGLDDVRVDIAMMWTPDGHGRPEHLLPPRPRGHHRRTGRAAQLKAAEWAAGPKSSGHGSSKIRGTPAARQRAWTIEDIKA